VSERPQREARPVLPADAVAPRPPVLTPLDVANIVTRNLVPVVGVLAFQWSAASLLILYFVDTLLAMSVIFAGFIYHALHNDDVGLADRINNWAGYVLGGVAASAIVAVPLAIPVGILVFGTGGHSFKEILADDGFKVGMALQAVASLISFRALVAALRRYAPQQLHLKRRFAILFLRWFCVIALAISPLAVLFGRFGALVLVVGYAVLTIFTEVNPTRFLAMMGEKDDATGSGATGSRAKPPIGSASKPRDRDGRNRGLGNR
jgi:hypothetical protein